MWESAEGNICSSILQFGSAVSLLREPLSPPDPSSIGAYVWVCSSSSVTPVASTLPPDWSHLNSAAVHLNDLGSEGLDGGQDQLLVLQGGDSKAQHVPGGHGRER